MKGFIGLPKEKEGEPLVWYICEKTGLKTSVPRGGRSDLEIPKEFPCDLPEHDNKHLLRLQVGETKSRRIQL